MKKLNLFVFIAFSVFRGFAEPVPADDILDFVRSRLPSDTIQLTGTLKVRTERGRTKTSLPVAMTLSWGAATPSATYRIGDQALDIVWKSNNPDYTFSNPANLPTSTILDTGLTWADLSFSVLWWPGSKLVDETKKINRDCYVVEVPVPDSDQLMRLWIEKKMGMLLEARTLDANGKEIRRMKIRSIKKSDGMWIAKDLEITDQSSGNKTTLQVTDLQREKVLTEQAAFDPAASVNRFSFDLYKKLGPLTDQNLFFSPYSISSALAMTYGGARGNTATEMETALHFGGQGATHPAFSHLRKTIAGIQQKGQVQLSSANSLWPQIDYAFLPDYLAMTQEFYGSTIEPVDYKTSPDTARLRINGWVEDQTNDRIKDLIPAGMLDPLTRLVLANAIYFKGNWNTQFKPEATHNGPFTLHTKETVDVPIMSLTSDFNFSYNKTFQALELPYEGEDLSMLILLPADPVGLAALEKNLTEDLITGLEFNKQEIMVFLPKFKLESEFSLGRLLASLGMPLAFSNQADFSGMSSSGELQISEVVHKAFIEVNEEGTEAAAATAVGIRTTSMPIQFEATRPFLFLIRENSSGATLFIGRVMDPST